MYKVYHIATIPRHLGLPRFIVERAKPEEVTRAMMARLPALRLAELTQVGPAYKDASEANRAAQALAEKHHAKFIPLWPDLEAADV
jgi:hypothetical protein